MEIPEQRNTFKNNSTERSHDPSFKIYKQKEILMLYNLLNTNNT